MKLPGYPCAVCCAPSNNITVNMDGRLAQFCSRRCAQIHVMKGPIVFSDDNEGKALAAGGKLAGQYLESIGKTDLTTMTKAEWDSFCRTMFKGTCAELQRLADDEIPF